MADLQAALAGPPMLEAMLATVRQSFVSRRATQRFAALARTHELRYLFLEITRRCNLACAYCGSGCSPAWSRPELDSAQWIAVLQQIARDFVPSQVMLAITGGEPLAKPGFFDIVAAADALGFPYGMVTNGTLLTPSVARRLAASNIAAISLSLDGPPEWHDRHRGHGSAALVERAIANLRQAGYRRRLEIISTIVKPVVPHLGALRAQVAALRVAEWRLAPLIPIGRAADRPDLVPDAADVRAILDFVRASRADSLLPRPEFGEECYLGDEYEGVVRPFRFSCRAGLTVGGILSDGRIGACPELSSAFTQGDIRTDRFADVWSTRYQIFRDRRWTRRGSCAGCDGFEECQGGSLHLYSSLEAEPLRCLYKMVADSGTAAG